MLNVKIDEILLTKGKTRYWLAKQCGISQNNLIKICNGETTSIRFDTLEKICKILNCSVTDILVPDDPQLKRLWTYQSKINELNQKD